MKEFTVYVEETLVRPVAVEAADEREAVLKVKDMYVRGEVVLDASDFDGDPEFYVGD